MNDWIIMKTIRAFIKSQIFLFMLMGTLSTLVMLGLYMLLNMIIQYQMAYFLSYVVTVIISYFLNTLLVFKKPVSLRTFLQFPIVYIVQYIISALMLEVMVRIGFSVTYAPVLIIILLLPLTFFLSRLVL
jgi:putative flippase GtrA